MHSQRDTAPTISVHRSHIPPDPRMPQLLSCCYGAASQGGGNHTKQPGKPELRIGVSYDVIHSAKECLLHCSRQWGKKGVCCLGRRMTCQINTQASMEQGFKPRWWQTAAEQHFGIARGPERSYAETLGAPCTEAQAGQAASQVQAQPGGQILQPRPNSTSEPEARS